MLTEYIQRAMRHAHYELTEAGRFFGSISLCNGAWGEGKTLEECRDELQGALESWVISGLRHGDTLPVIDGIDLNPKAQYAQAD
ncbi:MAG: type II toxin-antitoxin system HicB family antitoxin [Limisphaerales bacterium]